MCLENNAYLNSISKNEYDLEEYYETFNILNSILYNASKDELTILV